jgi:myo-inositol-1(or 4)-monophosphatase
MNFLDFHKFIEFVDRVTDEVSKSVNEYFDSNFLNKRFKVDGTIVTDADLNAEKYIRDQIKNFFPGHGILGEELDDELINDENKWVVDPIDGTFSFAKGVPLFGTLIGFIQKEIPLYGSLRLPKLGNDLLVGNNEICILNGEKIQCNSFKSWSDALVLTTDENRIAQSSIAHKWELLKTRNAQFRTWGDCYGYYLLCLGKADIMLDIDLKPYDILPIVPILKGAGISVIDFSEEKNYTSVVACKPELEKELSSIFLEK